MPFSSGAWWSSSPRTAPAGRCASLCPLFARWVRRHRGGTMGGGEEGGTDPQGPPVSPLFPPAPLAGNVAVLHDSSAARVLACSQVLPAVRAALQPATSEEQCVSLAAPALAASDGGAACPLPAMGSPEVTRDGLWLLGNVATGPSEHARAVIDAGFIPMLVALLRQGLFDVRREAAHAVCNIASSPLALPVLLQEGAVEATLPLTSSKDWDLVERVVELAGEALALGSEVRGWRARELGLPAPHPSPRGVRARRVAVWRQLASSTAWRLWATAIRHRRSWRARAAALWTATLARTTGGAMRMRETRQATEASATGLRARSGSTHPRGAAAVAAQCSRPGCTSSSAFGRGTGC